VEALATVVAAELTVLIGGLAIVVVYGLLTGRINVVGLLSDKSAGKSRRAELSTARVQLLLATIVGALLWGLSFAKSGGQIPEPPQDLLLLLGGSHALYLASKSGTRLFATSHED
jgi:hypothetical protein